MCCNPLWFVRIIGDFKKNETHFFDIDIIYTEKSTKSVQRHQNIRCFFLYKLVAAYF